MEYQDIVTDLEKGKAILFIGPEAMRLGNKSITEHLHELLLGQAENDIIYYYQKDNLFLFSDSKAKFRTQEQVEKLSSQLAINEEWLLQLASLPFPLIFSLTPDTFLRDTFDKYGIPHSFVYFREGKTIMQEDEILADKDIPKGEKGKPLICNLFGIVSEYDSLILDYEDMFKLVQGILSPEFSTTLKARLQRATTHIFIGFDFEKWYTPLLIRALCERNPRNKYAFLGETIPQETYDFLIKEFDISFAQGEKEGETLLDCLYRHCEKANILRPIVTAYSDKQLKIMRLIYSAKILAALEELLKEKEFETEVIAFSARFHSLEEGKARMDSRDYSVEWNKVVYGLLEIVKQV